MASVIAFPLGKFLYIYDYRDSNTEHGGASLYSNPSHYKSAE